MSHRLHLIIFGVFLLTPLTKVKAETENTAAANTQTETEKLVKFLDRIESKKFKTQLLKGAADDGSYTFEYQKTVAITRVAEHANGVSFVVQSLIRQRDVPAGSVEAINRDRMAVLICELGERQGPKQEDGQITKKLLGFCRTEVSGVVDPMGEAYSLTVNELSDTTLVWTKDQLFYSDKEMPSGEIESVATASAFNISLSEDDVTATEKVQGFSVDVNTSPPERTLSEEFELNFSEVLED